MTFERTTDYELIKKIVSHPKVYPYVSDDHSPAPQDWKPIENDVVWYVLVKDGGEILGMWIFIPETQVCWKVHTCLLPNAYGERARKAAKLMAQWIWENTTCLRIVTDVPKYNRLAYHFARAAGMQEFGLNPRSYMKSGILHDQILLGMSKCQ